MDALHHQFTDLQWQALGSFRVFDTGSLGTCCSWNQDTTLQNQAVPVQSGVPGSQNQQRRRVYDPGIGAEDQGLANALVTEGSSYNLGICQVLQNLHTPVFHTDELVEQD